MSTTATFTPNEDGEMVAETSLGDGGYDPDRHETQEYRFIDDAWTWVTVAGHDWFYFPTGENVAHSGRADSADEARTIVERLLTGQARIEAA